MHQQTSRVKDLENELNTEKDILDKYKRKILDVLEENGLESFETPECRVNKATRLNVKIEDREKFFEYLKANNLFEGLISVNSNTLNAWYRESLESAVASGATDLNIPGISETSSYTSLQVRKK